MSATAHPDETIAKPIPGAHMHDANEVHDPGRPWLARLDAALGLLVEVPAALLVLADIGVLFWGVIARFVLHRPLVWSDELASILFLWLAMLGSVVALRRGEHMRMTALVSKAGRERRALLEAVATSACLGVRRGGAGRHHAGARDLQCLARRRAAGGHRADDGLRCAAPAQGIEPQ